MTADTFVVETMMGAQAATWVMRAWHMLLLST
jgi:hypothetical protein